jgi:hypothetical protein
MSVNNGRGGNTVNTKKNTLSTWGKIGFPVVLLLCLTTYTIIIWPPEAQSLKQKDSANLSTTYSSKSSPVTIWLWNYQREIIC